MKLSWNLKTAPCSIACSVKILNDAYILLQGYNDQDYNQVDSALNSTAVKELDNDFAKLAREIPRPKQRTGDDDDDNMAGGLC